MTFSIHNRIQNTVEWFAMPVSEQRPNGEHLHVLATCNGWENETENLIVLQKMFWLTQMVYCASNHTYSVLHYRLQNLFFGDDTNILYVIFW